MIMSPEDFKKLFPKANPFDESKRRIDVDTRDNEIWQAEAHLSRLDFATAFKVLYNAAIDGNLPDATLLTYIYQGFESQLPASSLINACMLDLANRADIAPAVTSACQAVLRETILSKSGYRKPLGRNFGNEN